MSGEVSISGSVRTAELDGRTFDRADVQTFARERRIACRIAVLLADGRAATVAEIGRELRVRDADVRDVLRRDPRFERIPSAPGRSPQARPWTLAGELVPACGTSSVALGGFRPPEAQGQPFAPRERFWRLTLAAGAPRSVGEAVAAAERRAG